VTKLAFSESSHSTGLGAFLRTAGAAHRDGADDAAGAFLAAPEGGVDVGEGEGGHDGVDADAFGRDLLGEAEGEGVDGALGGRVVDAAVAAAGAAGQRRDVDDGAAPSARAVDMRRTASRAQRK
jgi:hypothetical protein